MAARSCIKLDESVIASGFLDTFDYVLTDCDGVLWIGNDAIPGSVEAIQALKRLNKDVIYVTNNSTKSCDEYLEKCRSFGFPATEKNVFSTSNCVSLYLQSLNFQKKVYVIGSSGIIQELSKAKISHLPIGPDNISEEWIKWADTVELEPDVGAVVIGFDQYISFPKLVKAASYLKNPDTLFIGTNKDQKFPTDKGLVIPGSGSFVETVEVATARKATVLGKPEKFILDCVISRFPDINLSRCIMIGDSLNTDIMLGTRHGLKAILVLTGINSLEDVRQMQESSNPDDHLLVPDYYLPCLGDILPLIKK